jgi:hypothetical protein
MLPEVFRTDIIEKITKYMQENKEWIELDVYDLDRYQEEMFETVSHENRFYTNYDCSVFVNHNAIQLAQVIDHSAELERDGFEGLKSTVDIFNKCWYFTMVDIVNNNNDWDQIMENIEVESDSDSE